ncbi:MAG TPA: rod shape-determining protein RodA [Acidimicrobiales bacterium]|nr:rod shape-determining protein RodA [Acidimicrobiales bacterium]
MATLTVPRRSAGISGSSRRTPAAAWRHVDLGLAVATIGVALFGLLMIYSATRDKLIAQGLDPGYYLKRQSAFVVVGIVAMAVVASVDYRRLRDFAPVLYVGSVFALLAILSPLGKRSKGAQAWFQVGAYQLEPSEFAKIALIVALAGILASYRGRLGSRELLIVLGLSAVPFALIYKQPDLGTAMVLSAILFGVLLVAGVQTRHLAVLAVIGLVGVTLVIHFGALKKYQRDRLTAFLDSSSNVQATYNLNQSKIAISSGGVGGKGLFKGTQTNLSYVPEQQTDFIFTAVGEQLGLVGSALLLSLFVLMVWRTWRAATTARDATGTLICVGVLAMLVFQIFENVGMTMGIMPIAGIPLPFMSYGGSAIVASFCAIGLVLNVQMRRYS